MWGSEADLQFHFRIRYMWIAGRDQYVGSGPSPLSARSPAAGTYATADREEWPEPGTEPYSADGGL